MVQSNFRARKSGKSVLMSGVCCVPDTRVTCLTGFEVGRL